MATKTELKIGHFSKYEDENSKIVASGGTRKSIVFYGRFYHGVLSTTQPTFFENAAFINRGISGQTTLKCY
jgi:hypothetical protein